MKLTKKQKEAMRSKVGVRNRKSLTHFIADCTVCDWHTQDYLTGQKKAAAHARETGHIVNAELGYFCSYGG